MTLAARDIGLQAALTRDSVCAADDIDAPHAVTLALPRTATLGDLCDAVRKRGYLARIAGGQAAWVVTIARYKLAVLAQQSQKPLFLAPETTMLERICAGNPVCSVHIEYHTQHDPARIAQGIGPSDRYPSL